MTPIKQTAEQALEDYKELKNMLEVEPDLNKLCLFEKRKQTLKKRLNYALPELAQAVLRLLEENELNHQWQPIETAPKTGEVIWLGNDFSMRLGFWANGVEYEHHESIGGGWRDQCLASGLGPADLHFKPTRWHPIPITPAKIKELEDQPK